MFANFLKRNANVGQTRNSGEIVAESRLQAWAMWLLLTLGPILLFAFYSSHMVSGLANPDAMDYAQLGRNLLNGHGFSTWILRPLALTHGSNPLAQPELTHGPLYPLLLALAFGVLRARDSAVLCVSGLFFVLTVPVLFMLGRSMFQRTVGLIAALVFMTNGMVLAYTASGTPTTLYAFLGACLFLTLYFVAAAAAAGKPTRNLLVLAGMLCGLLYLADPLFFWIFPVVLVSVILMHPTRRALAVAAFAVPLCVLILPWMVRNGLLTGNPIFGLRGSEVWMGTTALPGLEAYRMAGNEITPGTDMFKGVALKFFFNAASAVNSLQQLPASWILLFAVPGLFFRFSQPAIQRTRQILVASLLSVLAGTVLFYINPPILLFAVPALLVFALAYLIHIMAQAKLTRASQLLAGSLLGSALLLPLLAALLSTHTPATTTEAGIARTLGQTARPGEACFSDQPWIVAWYSGRPAIWIPKTDSDVKDLRRQFTGARWLFLTAQAQGLSPQWNRVFREMMGWNAASVQAAQAHTTPPPTLRVTAAGQPGGAPADPLIEALDGFEAVPPTEQKLPAAVLAVAPPAAKH